MLSSGSSNRCLASYSVVGIVVTAQEEMFGGTLWIGHRTNTERQKQTVFMEESATIYSTTLHTYGLTHYL